MARPPLPRDSSTLPGAVGASVQARRLKLGLSVADAAERAGVSGSCWYDYEAGRCLTVASLGPIAAALRCRPAALVPR